MTDIQQFLEWNRRQGHKILKTETSYWVSAGMGTYQAIPYHATISPTDKEIQGMFQEHHATAIRYSTPLTSIEGSLSYHIIYAGKQYPPKNLPKKVKKGLSVAIIEPIPLSRLATEGWKLRCDTLIRQGRTGAEKQDWWKKLCLSGEGISGLEAWGAIVDGNLAAALLGMRCDDTFSIFFQQSLTQYLRYGVNNALTYVTTSEILRRSDVNCIFYGLHSLDAPDSVDEFKIHMGYRAKPVRQRVVFSPFLRPFVNNISHKMLQISLKLFPHNHIFSKAEGMFRFYLNGKLPLDRQVAPAALASSSNEIDE